MLKKNVWENDNICIVFWDKLEGIDGFLYGVWLKSYYFFFI